MGASVSINDMVRRIRQRADQINSMTFDDEGELKPWLRDSLSQLHDTLVTRWDDYYLTTCPLSLSAGVDVYGLPFNFRALHNIYLVSGKARSRLSAFDGDDTSSIGPLRYRLVRTSLQLKPAPNIDMPNVLIIEYSSAYVAPLLDYTPIDVVLPAGWDEWAILDVLCKMATKTRLLRYADILSEKSRLEQRLIHSSYRRSDDAPLMRDLAGGGCTPRPLGIGGGPTLWTGA